MQTGIPVPNPVLVVPYVGSIEEEDKCLDRFALLQAGVAQTSINHQCFQVIVVCCKFIVLVAACQERIVEMLLYSKLLLSGKT